MKCKYCETGVQLEIVDATEDEGGFVEQYRCQSCGSIGKLHADTKTGAQELTGCLEGDYA